MSSCLDLRRKRVKLFWSFQGNSRQICPSKTLAIWCMDSNKISLQCRHSKCTKYLKWCTNLSTLTSHRWVCRTQAIKTSQQWTSPVVFNSITKAHQWRKQPRLICITSQSTSNSSRSSRTHLRPPYQLSLNQRISQCSKKFKSHKVSSNRWILLLVSKISMFHRWMEISLLISRCKMHSTSANHRIRKQTVFQVWISKQWHSCQLTKRTINHPRLSKI